MPPLRVVSLHHLTHFLRFHLVCDLHHAGSVSVIKIINVIIIITTITTILPTTLASTSSVIFTTLDPCLPSSSSLSSSSSSVLSSPHHFTHFLRLHLVCDFDHARSVFVIITIFIITIAISLSRECSSLPSRL